MRCLANHQIANCALQPVVFAQSWKTTSNRQVFRTSTYCGTPRDTAEYLCLASDVRQRPVSFWIGRNLGVGRKCQLESLSVFDKSNVRRVYNPPAEYKGRVGAVRLVCGDVDLSVAVPYMWPEPCVSDRERNRRVWLFLDCTISYVPGRSIPLFLLDANGHTGLQMVEPKVWRPVSRDAIGHRFPQC